MSYFAISSQVKSQNVWLNKASGLRKDRGTRTFQVLVGQPMWNPVQSQDVTIRGSCPVFLCWITVGTDQLRRGEIVFRPGRSVSMKIEALLQAATIADSLRVVLES